MAVTCEVHEHVAQVRIDRPEKRNALRTEEFVALVEIGEELARRRDVRAVVLAGVGDSFCAGLDMANFGVISDGGGADSLGFITAVVPGRETHGGQQAAHVWREIPVPVLAAVRGHALGAGFQIALAADLRIVHPDAQLSALEIRWGLVPDMTATQYLPALVGLDRAKELVLTGRMVSGTEAVSIGLATRLADDPVGAATELAVEIASKNPDAVRYSKSLLDGAGRVGLPEGFAAERTAMNALIGSPNQREAIAAFQQRRPPLFSD